MDEAITLIEAAVSVKPPHMAEPGSPAKPTQTGTANVPQAPAKTTKVVKASEFSTKTYLETEADVNVYISKLKEELLAAVRAGKIARIQ
jgi:hypothetical protein